MGSFLGLESDCLTLPPSGRLAGCWTAGEGVGFSGHKKSRGILEGESPRQLKFQRPV